jgi:predicted nucleotidyltransferase component of viral defense system
VIPAAAVTHWAAGAPWPTRTQVEQDLLLSRVLCEIANDPYLGEELVFRGGTCFHKLHIHPARRYSEDLDYVRSTGGGIREFTQAMTNIGHALGFEVKTKVGVNPKVYLLAASDEGLRMRIKVEVNTRERSPADPVQLLPYEVQSPWWAGQAQVRTFSTRELVATKIRALYQRKKSRDVFDMWLALTELGLSGEDLLAVFEPYHPASLTAKTAEANLRDKLSDHDFRHDLDPFVTGPPPGYDLDTAAEMLIATVLSKIPKPRGNIVAMPGHPA